MSLSAAANKISDNDFQNIGPAPRPPSSNSQGRTCYNQTQPITKLMSQLDLTSASHLGTSTSKKKAGGCPTKMTVYFPLYGKRDT